MSSDLHAALMAARRPGGGEADRFDDHVVACVLAIAAREAEEGASLAEATGLDAAALSALVAERFPGAVGWFDLGGVGAPEISLEEELLRDLLAAHAVVETGAGSDGASADRAGAGLDGAMVIAPGSSPPSRGRDREGGADAGFLLGVFADPGRAHSASMLAPPPPPGAREPEGRRRSDIDVALAPPLAPLLARLVARRAMRADHLWQDLGLADRSELNRMLARHFPALHAGNTGNMRWKKYFYRRLCEAEGFVLCTAPSCAVCTDFASCFGAEDGESRLARVRRAHDGDRMPVSPAETPVRRVAAE
jgi:nitrogen fixation protein NifQ